MAEEHKMAIDDIGFNFFKNELCVFGNAASCTQQLLHLAAETGIDNYSVTFNLTTLDYQLSLESMKRFALNVMPRLRGSLADHQAQKLVC